MRTWLSNSMPFAEWPAQDSEPWARAQVAVDPLAPGHVSGGGGARWRETSRRYVKRGYSQWLWWLRSYDLLDPQTSPGLRATPEIGRAHV